MRVRQVLAMSVAVLVLSGCTAAAFPAFEREPTAADAVPDGVPIERLAGGAVAPEDVRFAGEFEGVGLYLVVVGDTLPCLLVADGDESSMACGGTGAVRMETPSGVYELAPAPIADGEGWTIVSENVRARPAG